MKNRIVKELMVPIHAYESIPEEATLGEAALALKQALDASEKQHDRHWAVVAGENGEMVGLVTPLDVLRGLEPMYDQVLGSERISLSGFSREFLRSMLDSYRFWDKPFAEICGKAVNRKVKEFMYVPTHGEYVNENASLDEGLHRLIMGRHDALLVTKGKSVVGVLRLRDVYREAEKLIEACETE
jgi:hypothetical protein